MLLLVLLIIMFGLITGPFSRFLAKRHYGPIPDTSHIDDVQRKALEYELTYVGMKPFGSFVLIGCGTILGVVIVFLSVKWQTSLLLIIIPMTLVTGIATFLSYGQRQKVIFNRLQKQGRLTRCPQCGYNIEHITSDTCPECGRYVEQFGYRNEPPHSE